MTPTELEYADKRMRQKWHDLVIAEQQGASTQTLERMYNAYMLCVEEYNRCSEQYRQEHEPLPAPVQYSTSTQKRKKKAS